MPSLQCWRWLSTLSSLLAQLESLPPSWDLSLPAAGRRGRLSPHLQGVWVLPAGGSAAEHLGPGQAVPLPADVGLLSEADLRWGVCGPTGWVLGPGGEHLQGGGREGLSFGLGAEASVFWRHWVEECVHVCVYVRVCGWGVPKADSPGWGQVCPLITVRGAKVCT